MARTRWLGLGLLVVAIAGRSLAIDPTAAKAPAAKAVPHKTELHGDTRVDNYFWLRDKKSPDVVAYLEAENAYTAAVMKPTEPLQEKLYKEMLGRIKQTDLTVPYRDRGYWYYTRTEEGKQYPIACRKKGDMDSPEEVTLDLNEMAKGEKFFRLDEVEVSDDGNLLAYLTDTTGFREYYLSVKDLRTGKVLESRFVKAVRADWAADNKTLFYLTEDDAKRSHKLWRHTLGKPRDADALIYEENDELFSLDVQRSRDRKYLFHTSHSSTSTEQWYLPADDPMAEWKVILPREARHEYTADHRDGLFYIQTNRGGATNFKIVVCPVGSPHPANWRDFVPYDPKVMIGELTMFRDYAVVSEREGGLPQLRVIDLVTGVQHRIDMPEPVYDVSPSMNAEFDTTRFRFVYSSLVTPASDFEYGLDTRDRRLLKRTPVLGGYEPSQYQSERVHATAPDGARVPISLVYKKGVKKDGTAPLLLYGYGSYGSTLGTSFDANLLSLLDRGVIYAQAHIRGGSDLGRDWYESGKMLSKKNTFTDFIACADHLVKEKYCSRDRLAIQGASAGGLLIGSVVNMRPDLCKTAVLQMPFVDVINTMLDESLPLTVQEFLEWGNPKNRNEYEYMKTYCPYTNLTKAAYPSILVTTSFNDSQVMYWEPTKYVAKLRTLKTDRNPLLFKCNMAGGHDGLSGRYDALKDQAFVTAFVLDQLGVAK
ncbi:MAG TPA: S9 family peptidase [Gemmataceae bacterium]|nr:S9 family peptidase [Gemmataceae bacterium]